MGLIRWFRGLFAPAAPAAPAAPEAPRDAPPPSPPPSPLPKPAAARVWPRVLGATIVGVHGELLCATPTRDVWIQGVPCRAGAVVTFAPNGRIASATLALAHTVENELLTEGFAVRFDPDGRLRGWAGALTAARTFATRGAGGEDSVCDVALAPGTQVAIEWGRLRSATLTEGVTIDGWEFPARTELIWGDSGALSHATCPEVMTLAGVRWAAHETVVFMFGRLQEGYPDEDGALHGLGFQRGEIVRLYDNGRVARCYLAADTTLSGVPCQAGTRVYLSERGELIEGTLAVDTELDGIPVAAGSVVSAHGGVVVALTPRADCEIDGVPCAAGAMIERGEAGRLLRATLSRAHAVGGYAAPAGSVGQWREDGAPRLLVLTDGRAPDGSLLEGTWTVLWSPDGAVRRSLPTTAHSRTDALSLRAETVVDGLRVAARTTVELGPDGALRSAVMAADQPLGGLVAKQDTRVRWSEHGELLSLSLAADTRIGDLVCAGATTLAHILNDVERGYNQSVRLHPDGSLDFATLAEDGQVMGVPLAKGSNVVRRVDGGLSVGTLSARWTHPSGLVAARGTLLGLFEDGSPSLVTLAEPCGEYPSGTVLQYLSPGALKGAGQTVVPLGPVVPLREDEPDEDRGGCLEGESAGESKRLKNP